MFKILLGELGARAIFSRRRKMQPRLRAFWDREIVSFEAILLDLSILTQIMATKLDVELAIILITHLKKLNLLPLSGTIHGAAQLPLT